jgi:anaerobic magnesium-protoporphyrin IX monomethyl ester cyclase
MRVLFTNTCYQQRVEYTSLISVVPPLEIATCAALVRRDCPEVEVVLLDANAMGWTDAQLARRIRDHAPDVVVFWAATFAINAVRDIVAELACGPETRVVLTGSHGSALPERTLEEIPGLDVIVRGEPEYTVLELIQAWKRGDSAEGVAGLHARLDHGDRLIATPDRAVCMDLDSLPVPARDLLPNHRYSAPWSTRVTALRTTRGCPGACRFCDSHLMVGRRTRTRDPVAVVNEMEDCARAYGTDYFAILDHTFTARRAFVEQVCEHMLRRRALRRVRWVCNTRVDMLSDELVSLMRRAGCLQIGLGIESADNARLSQVKKHITEDQIRAAIGRLKRHGIIAMGYTIIGFPDDDAERIERTKRKILDLDPHTLQLSFATPLPGTGLWDDCVAEDRILSDNWDDYVFLRKSIIRNDHLGPQQIEAARRDIVKSFWLRPGKLAQLGWFLTARARPSATATFDASLKVLRNM